MARGNTNPPPTHPTPTHKSKYDKYYIPGGDLYLVARGKHFCIHSYFFTRESAHWDSLVALPGDARKPRGLHEDNPIDIDEDPEHVADFLWVFYNQEYRAYNRSLHQWTNILRLATKWDFSGAQQFAISNIDKMSMGVIEKIKLYQDLGVPRSCVLHHYIDLAIRERMLEREVFNVLDGDILYSIVRARELLRAPVSVDPTSDTLRSPIRPGLIEEEKRGVVATAFGVSPQEVQLHWPSATPNSAGGSQTGPIN